MTNIQGQSWVDSDVPTRQRMNWKEHIYDTGANINALDLTTGLVSRWAFASDGTDSVGSNNLTNNGAATFVAGVYGNAANFNGTSQYFSVADNATLRPASITISAWVNPTVVNVDQVIVSKYSTDDAHSYFLNISSAGKVQFSLGNGTTSTLVNGATVLTAGTWYHIAGKYNGTTIVVYVNGIPDNNGTLTGPYFATGEFRIGARNAGALQYFTGKIDQVQLFNAALTDAQMKQVYADCHGGMLATCMSTGSGFTSGITYRRNVENTAWDQLDDTVSAQTITGAKTFSNANVNLSNNTVTDTSTAAGDLAKSNGTKFLRFAKGTAFQVLRTNSGATDIEYANCRFTELGRTQLGSDGTSISVASLPTVKRLIVLAEIKVGAGASTVGSIRFNNDSGTNYSYRYSENGAAEVTGTSQTSISFHGGSLSASETANIMMHISNDSANRKLSYISAARDGAVGAGTAPVRLEEAATWDNTASQINRIDFLGTNNFLSGSRVTVYGAD